MMILPTQSTHAITMRDEKHFSGTISIAVFTDSIVRFLLLNAASPMLMLVFLSQQSAQTIHIVLS